MNIKKLYATISNYLLSLLPGDPVLKAMTKASVEDIQKTCDLLNESRANVDKMVDAHKRKCHNTLNQSLENSSKSY